MLDLSLFHDQTPEEVLGSMHYSHYLELKNQQTNEFRKTRLQVAPIVYDLARLLEEIIQIPIHVEYRAPEMIHVADMCGTGHHYFALRVALRAPVFNWVGWFWGRRTAVLIAMKDPYGREGYDGHPVYITVSRVLKTKMRGRLLQEADAFLMNHIPYPEKYFIPEVGLGNCGTIQWCSHATRTLMS